MSKEAAEKFLDKYDLVVQYSIKMRIVKNIFQKTKKISICESP